MPFIKGKVALITGGASGIGLVTAKEMIRKGLKAAVLADINPEFGETAIREITNEFGDNKAIFKQTDVTNKSSVKEVFEETIKNFEQLDIVINNAGIMNDKIWEQEIDINCNLEDHSRMFENVKKVGKCFESIWDVVDSSKFANILECSIKRATPGIAASIILDTRRFHTSKKGVVYGTLLALEEYIPKFKKGKEGIVVNIASVAGLDPFELTPIYSATKSFVVQFSRSIASDFNYNRSKVKVMTVCPGSTDTPLSYLKGKLLNAVYEEMLEEYEYSRQSPEFLAEEIVSAIEKGKNGTTWVIEESPAAKIHFKDRFELQKK